MATNFMQGYNRPNETQEKLVAAIGKALAEHPSLRLGQLLYVAVSKTCSCNDTNIGSRLFTIFDEELIKSLESFKTETQGGA